MEPRQTAVRKVRLLRLSLAGFGRYRSATTFELGGGSRVFLARNEQGKSTFVRGLLYTLFGVPGGKRRAAFVRKYYNWSRPEQFWGRVEFETPDGYWVVLRDFRRDTVTVTLRGREGEKILLNRHRHRERASDTRQDPYDDLLYGWFGIRYRTIYEAIFCIDQRSSLLIRSQIDERIWRYFYGNAVAAIEKRRKRLYEEFRALTAKTRDHGVSLAASGGRNGRNPGQIEQIEEKLQCLRQERDELIAELRQLSDACQDCDIDGLRKRLHEASESLERWKRWRDLHTQLLAAVQTLEQMKPGTESDTADSELPPAVRKAVGRGVSPEDMRKQLLALEQQIHEVTQLRESSAEARARLAGLEQQLAEISRTVRESCSADTLRELIREGERLRALESELERLEGVRAELDQEVVSEDQSPAAIPEQLSEVAREALEHEERLRELEGELQAISDECSRLEKELARTRAAAERADGLLAKHRREEEEYTQQLEHLRQILQDAERSHEEQFGELQGAPPGLPMLWDRYYALRQELDQLDRSLHQVDIAERVGRSRLLWRRGLLALGTLTSLACFARPVGALDLVVGVACGLLTVAVLRAFPAPSRHAGNADELRNRRRRVEQEIRAVLGALGSRFRPNPERETEIRRLWAQFEQSRKRLEELQAEIQRVEELRANVLEERKRIEADLDATVRSARAETEEYEQRLDEVRKLQAAKAEQRSAVSARLARLMEEHFSVGVGDAVRLDEIPAPAHWADCVSRSETGEQPTTLRDLLVALASGSVRGAGTTGGDQRVPEASADPWRAEVWWSARNIGLIPGPDDGGPPDEFDPDDAIARMREEARALRGRLEAVAGTADPDRVAAMLEEVEAAEQLAGEVREAMTRVRDELATLEARIAELEHAVDSDLKSWFDACGQDVEAAVEEYRRLTREHDQAADGGTETAESRLAEEVERLREQSRELLATYPDLLEAVEQPPEYAAARCNELAREIDSLREQIAREEERRAMHERRTDQLKGRLDEIEGAIHSLEQELAELADRRDQLAAEFRAATEELESARHECREKLQARVTALFREFSCHPGRHLLVDESLKVLIKEGEEQAYVPAHLSHGARDQLCLAVYLALAADLDLPFVFDDPFVNCDEERLGAIRQVWDRLMAERQLILLSHSSQFEGWAPPVLIEGESAQTQNRVAA